MGGEKGLPTLIPSPLQPMRRSARIASMPRILPLLLLCAAAHAAEVAQFRAEDFDTPWRAALGTDALVPVHAATNGWTAPFPDGDGVSFLATNGVASPLAFDPTATGAVSRVLLVADCAEARPWATLLDAPVGAALAPTPFSWDEPRFATSNCLGAVAVSVDGIAGAAMPTNETPHLVEVVFPEPVAASELYLGGHPATPAWNRAWPGRVFEARFCFAALPDTDLALLRAHLALEWDLPLSSAMPSGAAARLRALGVRPGPRLTSVLLLR